MASASTVVNRPGICDDTVITLIDDYISMRERCGRGLFPPKCIVILRGVPGCGKTTYARCVELYASAKHLEVCRLSPREDAPNQHGFRWDRPLLHLDTRNLLERFATAAGGRHDVVIVDDENVRREEVQAYLDAVRGYHAKYVVGFRCQNIQDALWLCHRSRPHEDVDYIHGCFDAFQQGGPDVGPMEADGAGFIRRIWIQSRVVPGLRVIRRRQVYVPPAEDRPGTGSNDSGSDDGSELAPLPAWDPRDNW